MSDTSIDLWPAGPFRRFGLRIALYMAIGIAPFITPGVLMGPDVESFWRIGTVISTLSAVLMTIAFLLPTWRIHRRLRDRKAELLQEVQSELEKQKRIEAQAA